MTRESIARPVDLKAIYRQAAQVAHDAGVKAGDQDGLVAWIRANCRYRPDTEFFLVLGIGSELADVQARSEGYRDDVHRAFTIASESIRRDNLIALINTWNESSSPSVARTDSEHAVERDRARIALASIKRNYVEGTDYKELSNGALWPMGGN